MDEIQVLQETVKKIEEKLDVILNALMGNPLTPNEPGIIIRLDRLEQSNIFKNKILWAFGAALAVAIAQATTSLM